MEAPKLTKEEAKTHKETTRRRRVLDANAGEEAVAKFNAFLAEQGITEEEWEKQSEMRGRRQEKG